MKEINNKGFGKIEFMTILGLMAVLIAVGAKMAVDSGKNYSAFKTTATNFLSSVAMYKDMYTKDSNIYYLHELIEKGYSSEIKNPMDSKTNCDKYESYVEVPSPNNKKIHLECGEYIVEGNQKDGFKVYEVGKWNDKKENGDNDTNTLYNYKKDGVLAFDGYVPEKTFVQLYFDKNQSLIKSPFDLSEKDGIELLTKNVYRTKKLVKEL